MARCWIKVIKKVRIEQKLVLFYLVNTDIVQHSAKRGNVIQLYIRVSVVLSRQHCRKEREKLDINLDSAVLWECH